MLDQRAGRLFTGGMSVVARRVPVVSTYHGVEVSEDYRWLEDASSPETIAWTQEQAELTREYFASIPWREDLRTRVDGLLRADRSTYTQLAAGGDTYFVLKEQTPRQRPFLVTLTDLDDTTAERVLVDPECDRPDRRDGDRLVRATAGWTSGGGVDVRARHGGRHAVCVRRRQW